MKDKEICNKCTDKSCIHRNYRYSLNYKSCGVGLYPAKIKYNSYCILCAGCLKTCKTYQSEQNLNRPNPGFVKVGFVDGLYKGYPLLVAEWFFLFVVSGFVIYEILSEFESAKLFLLALPNYINELFSISNIIVNGLIKSFYLFLLLPALFWFLPYLIILISKSKISFKTYITYFGLAFIPIVASAHLCKSILKITSRIPYFEYVINDFQGIKTAEAIISKQITLQIMPIWSGWFITITITLLLLIGYIISIKTINRLIHKLSVTDNLLTLRLITILYFLVFFVDVMIWRWI